MSRSLCNLVISEENCHIQIDLAGCMVVGDVIEHKGWYYKITTLLKEGSSCEGTLSKYRKVGQITHRKRK